MYTTKTVGSQTTSPWIPLDDNQAAFNVSVAVAVTGTLTYTVQFTLDNIQDPSVTPVAFDVSSLTGKTTAASTSLRSSVKAVRLNVTSYTSGSATIGVRQGTSWDGADFATSAGPVTLFQGGIPFWLPPGDGGANGLIFDGLRGTFTLSAAILTNFWNLVKTPTGGYCYLPATSGGLVTGGLYFFRMTSDTAGEVYQEMYVPGSGPPVIPSNPTAHPNLTAARITQTTAEVLVVSFVIPGGSLGPNGIIRGVVAQRANSHSGIRSLRIKAGATGINYTTASTTNTVLDYDFVRQNQGVQNYQMGNRTASGWFGQAQTSISGDYTGVDFSVDQTINVTLQTDTNSNSLLAVLRDFVIKYGA